MNSNSFFKPTPLYNEFMILDLIEKDSNITQREISKAINIAVSMVNNYLNEYEEEGLIIRKKYSSKTVEYFITINGKERRKKLNIDYLNASQKLYNSAKENIEEFLAQIESRGFKKILLYGAGEVAEILLQTIVTNKNSQVDVLAVIDDDINKQGKERNQRIFFINVVDNSVLFFNINRYSQCFLCSRNFYFAYVFFIY